MISELLWTMAVLATLALGFLLGRIWADSAGDYAGPVFCESVAQGRPLGTSS